MDYIIKDGFFVKKIQARYISESDIFDNDDILYIKLLKSEMDYLGRKINQRHKRKLALQNKMVNKWKENALGVKLKNTQENLKK